ncbi:uncharacterized protein BCR38DRAFT_154664 [Pseudomassariella vexata]|uniref:Uncharacterized protein n=1 Tax=Pseudomassariella vexata TaxID=1141098 RepID=A0A1Y2E8W3_9PEZI|nr:uncharacterized protein BCR38DRAFT_154664 [Pseudomassariella vexata]ORY67305.1 hypothetical protein BCR38DRAFT_154664 [Pseudomassariella vexata]
MDVYAQVRLDLQPNLWIGAWKDGLNLSGRASSRSLSLIPPNPPRKPHCADVLKHHRSSNLESHGYLYIHDIDFVFRCDDGTLHPSSTLVRQPNRLHEAATKAKFARPRDATRSHLL